MKNRLLLLLIPAMILLLSIHSGASVLSLAGSDPAPYEKEFNSFCYSNLQIQAPPSNVGGGGSYKVREVVVTGNFSRCRGYTILLTAQKNVSQKSYALHVFIGNETQVTLRFDSGNGDGDWREQYPSVVNGQLVANGAHTPPLEKLEVEQITWLISNSW